MSFLSYSSAYNQELALEVIGSAGGEEQNEITLQWTIGEFLVNYDESPSVTLSEGFHQLLIADRDFEGELQIRAEIFPNPTANVVQIEVNNSEDVSYVLLNPLGQVIQRGDVVDELQLDLSYLVQGVYVISFLSQFGFSKSFQLVKI